MSGRPALRSMSGVLVSGRSAPGAMSGVLHVAEPRRGGIARNLDRGGTPLDVEVLAQRMVGRVLGHDDAPQVGMALEADPDEIVRLALGPVGAGPDRRDAWHRLARLQPH